MGGEEYTLSGLVPGENYRHGIRVRATPVPADSELTTRGCALTSACRVPMVVNSNRHNPPKLLKLQSAVIRLGIGIGFELAVRLFAADNIYKCLRHIAHK